MYKQFVCTICGFVYDEAKGLPDDGIPAGTLWESLGDDWSCTQCGAPKSAFEEVKQEKPKETKKAPKQTAAVEEDLQQLSWGELSAMCSNLALQCEKQQLSRQQELFTALSDKFLAKADLPTGGSLNSLWEKVNDDLKASFPEAEGEAEGLA